MTYQITTDPTLLPPNAQPMISFMESFYQTSDTEAWHDKYVASFTDDATLIMGPKVATGADEIRALRHGLWTHVAARKHAPSKIFFGGPRELMLYGTVKCLHLSRHETFRPDNTTPEEGTLRVAPFGHDHDSEYRQE
ncbi:uncharacterized protein ACLA_029300 [Aspergillus clavatus NRRL 1]|uniref:SnoaL-like domain-containing protein n=1 Tax=Aspergillus clavatus (strain ATCC 1007 / CBS 513.65 / DSM 816 / NCTC 3887 / NRRL 1 / QM 1276 / 107) TaxID=344612 RepID=A1CRD1_ASPCL|nr:uncharacterized protein ACLA_029300 [Aspergillus clavatus NRRL 1]EAW08202.1 conserved hypothetical protein [Aspergillus clavatus NRRL 1]